MCTVKLEGFHHRPAELEALPEEAVHAAGLTLAGEPGPHQVAHVEESAEEGEEEHDFREDEPEHAEHVGLLQLGAVHARQVLLDRDSEPGEQGGHKEKQADQEDRP
jgi:hypothetical protein